MSESPIAVVAAFYPNETGASDVLKQLKQMDKDKTVDIIDAAVIVKGEDGRKVKISETGEFTPSKGAWRGAAAGAVIGLIFPPSILAMGAIGAAAGAALGHFTDQGFDNNLLREIGENLPSGGSVIVAVIEETWVAKLETALQGYVDLERYALDADAATVLEAQLS